MEKQPSGPPTFQRIGLILLFVMAAFVGFWVAYRSNRALYGAKYAMAGLILGVVVFVGFGGYLLVRFFQRTNAKQ